MFRQIEHIVNLNDSYYKEKFIILAQFLSTLGEVDYRVVNILIQFYFQNDGGLIYTNFYEKYFIGNQNLSIKAIDSLSLKFSMKESIKLSVNQNYNHDIRVLLVKYNKLQKLTEDKLQELYFRIL